MATASEAQRQLIEKAENDSEFRELLIADPTKAVEEEFGVKLPEGFSIQVHEQASNVAHIVLPPPSRLGEEDLRSVAGGIEGLCWE